MDGHFQFEASDDYLPDIVDKTLSLTRNELLFIDDSLSMLVEKDLGDSALGTVRPLAHTAGLPAPLELIEKIGKGILFTVDPKNKGLEAKIPVSDTDLYMLREVALSYMKFGKENVGFKIKVKIYEQLFANDYKHDQIADTLLSQVDTTTKVLDNDSI